MFKRNSSGVIESRLRLYSDDFFSIYSILPPLQEQKAIAQFLDDKTAKIDEAIALKEKQIELLKERKQILIQDLVTGKKVWSEKHKQWIDTRTSTEIEMKDSGVEWIGEIPKHWEVKKLIGVSKLVRGNSPFSKDDLSKSGDYVAIQYGKSYKIDEVDEEYNYYVDKSFYKTSQVVNKGDTIIVSTSETLEDLGHTVYYNRKDLGLIGGEQMLIKPIKGFVNDSFLYLSSIEFSKGLRNFATGIKVFRFNVANLKSVSIPIPPDIEQRFIVNQLDFNSTKIDELISIYHLHVQKLKEYKTTLIDSAVTGKIRVPGVQE